MAGNRQAMPSSRDRWLLPLGLFILFVTWGYAWVLSRQAPVMRRHPRYPL